MTDARLAARGARSSTSVRSTRSVSRNANKRYYSGFRGRSRRGTTSGFAGTLLVTRDASLILADSPLHGAGRERGARLGDRRTRADPRRAPAAAPSDEIEALGMEAAVVTPRRLGGAGRGGARRRAPRDRRRACPACGSRKRRRGRRDRSGLRPDGRLLPSPGGLRAFGHDGAGGRLGTRAWFRATAPRASPSSRSSSPAPAAMPHTGHRRPHRARNVLLIDSAVSVDGYRSDMTRTLFVGEVPDEIATTTMRSARRSRRPSTR